MWGFGGQLPPKEGAAEREGGREGERERAREREIGGKKRKGK